MEFLSTKHLPFEEMDPHDVRVGFSLRTAPNILGEYMSSYCYTSLGRKASNNVFSDYGEPFHQDDVITSVIVRLIYYLFLYKCLNLSNQDIAEHTISFWKNDTCLGVAFRDVRLPDGDAVYPHICIKNCRVAVNFGEFPEGETMWKSNPEWRFPSSLGRGDLERSIAPPDSKANCTVLMMVGLPGVGKTTWVRQYLRDHPTEQWTVVNVEGIMNAMKVRISFKIILIISEILILIIVYRLLYAGIKFFSIYAIIVFGYNIILEVTILKPCLSNFIYSVYNEEARPWYQKKYKRRRAQNIGLGPDREPRRSMFLMRNKKYHCAAPLTVLPTLKVSITPIGVCTETTESATTPKHKVKVSTTADDNSPARTPTGTTTTPVSLKFLSSLFISKYNYFSGAVLLYWVVKWMAASGYYLGRLFPYKPLYYYWGSYRFSWIQGTHDGGPILKVRILKAFQKA
uniref:SPRY domain-containing protein n=1 Tax=Heterorhabditis bacteriophora TaxID=37862 RepID=A0A1I7W9S4_HETBA